MIERLSEGIANSSEPHKVAVLTTKYLFPRRYAAALPAQELIDGVTVRRLDGWRPRLQGRSGNATAGAPRGSSAHSA